MARVLVIDDEQTVRELVLEILAEAGCESESASTSDEALAALDARDFDLVISDMFMKELSGLELLGEARRRRPGTAVVLVTGHAAHATVSDALDAGADGLVMKPFSHAELLRTLAGALKRTARRANEPAVSEAR